MVKVFLTSLEARVSEHDVNCFCKLNCELVCLMSSQIAASEIGQKRVLLSFSSESHDFPPYSQSV